MLLFLIIYLFIYVFMAVLGLHFCARAFSSCSRWGPLFIAVRRPLIIAASLVAEQRLQTHRLSTCGSWASLLRGMWDPPRPGLEPVSPALAGRFSTTAPPGKALVYVLKHRLRFEFLPMNDQILQHHLTILSPLNYFYAFVKNQLGISVWIYFWLLYCVPLIYESILSPVPPSPYLYIVLKSNTLILYTLFFFKIILTILVSLTPKEGGQICYCWKRVSIPAPQVTSSDI